MTFVKRPRSLGGNSKMTDSKTLSTRRIWSASAQFTEASYSESLTLPTEGRCCAGSEPLSLPNALNISKHDDGRQSRKTPACDR